MGLPLSGNLPHLLPELRLLTMPECPVEPSVPHRIRLNVRISPKYSEYQIFGQKCAEYQILGKTPYILNFPAHTKIYLSSQRKQIQGSLDSSGSYNLPSAVHCVLEIQHDLQIILCVKDVMACNMRCYWACQQNIGSVLQDFARSCRASAIAPIK